MPHLVGKKSFKGLFILIDLGLIYLSYIIAFHLRYSEIPQRNWDAFLSISPWILLISFFFISIYEIYAIHRKNVWDIIRNIFVGATLISVVTMSVSFMFREFALPRSVLLISYLLMIMLLAGWKFVFYHLQQQSSQERVLLVAEHTEAEKIMHQIVSSYGTGTRFMAISPEEDLQKIFYQMNAADVEQILISSNMKEDRKAQIIYQAMRRNKIIYVIPSLYDLLLSKAMITSVDESMVMAVKPFGLTYDERFMKRLFDLVLTIPSLIIMLPIFAFVAIMVKIENPASPVIYKQKRLGKDNREFTLYKFRTMVEDAEKETGPVLAIKDDARITKVGKFLRATRLDEIPQLVNVLLGHMSLVGPRPEREYFINIFTKQHEEYQYRSTVKPGITGYAQVMGSYGADPEDKLRFDLYYIRNYSLWLDITIILRTIVVLIDNKKAEGKESVFRNHVHESGTFYKKHDTKV